MITIKPCRQITNAETFGICDDGNKTPLCCNADGDRPLGCAANDKYPAYIDINTANASSWIATVINPEQKEVTFTPIDNCQIILRNGTTDRECVCDGVITFDDKVYLVELKDKRSDWITEAVDQLESTIRILNNSGQTNEYRHRKAFACNRKHPNFHEIDNEKQSYFFRTYRFRLDVQAEIIVR